MAKYSMKPQIRFKGFTDAWEQRKLGAMAYRVNEMSAIEGLPRVEYEDIEAGQGTLNKNLKEKVSNKKGILFQHSDILYGKLRPYLKNWLFADFWGIAVGDFWVLRSNSVAHVKNKKNLIINKYYPNKILNFFVRFEASCT